MLEKSRFASLADPSELEVLRHVDPKKGKHIWDSELLELNGIRTPPTEQQLKAAIELTRIDETTAFDRYFEGLLRDATAFREIVSDANRGEFWERLGFYFNSAEHYAIAAEAAEIRGAKKWAVKLIAKAEEAYDLWKLLEKEDPLMLGDEIALIKKRISQ